MAIKILDDYDEDAEKIILTSLIVSDRYCAEVDGIFKEEYLESKYAKLISSWVLRYYRKFGKSPGKTIRNIYKVERRNFDNSTAKIIKKFLRDISREYESSKGVNIDYNVDFTRKYFQQRATSILFEEGHRLIDAGRFEDANELLVNESRYKLEKFVEGLVNPLDPEEILKYGSQMRDQTLFRFDGVLGDFLGDFNKSWLVSWVGPEKRGKSWWLLEAAFQGITKGVKTTIFSLEMNETTVKNRIYKRMTGMADEKDIRDWRNKGYEYLRFPVFDCKHNQLGTCTDKYSSRSPLLRGGTLPDYSPLLDYKPCDYCRRNRLWSRYKPAYWFTSLSLDKIRLVSRKDIIAKSISFTRRFGDNLRVKCYPAFTASFDDVKRDLERWDREGFVPSLICIDYPDIMAKENLRYIDNERASINATWQAAKMLADTRNCCVMVADQATRGARTRRKIKQTDTSEDKRKDAHLDMKITLNQTEDEQNEGVQRLSVMYHRHGRADQQLECLVLQQLTVAQPYLDSELWLSQGTAKKKDEERTMKKRKKRSRAKTF